MVHASDGSLAAALSSLSPQVIIGILLLVAEVAILLGCVAWAITRSARLPPPGLLVVSLSLLTLVLVVIYVFTRDSELLTLMGVPIGALAAATSSIYVTRQNSSNGEGGGGGTTADIPVVVPIEDAMAAPSATVSLADPADPAPLADPLPVSAPPRESDPDA
jgi:hypothetical protein